MLETVLFIILFMWCAYKQLWLYHCAEEMQRLMNAIVAIEVWIEKSERGKNGRT